jgi:4a-hydroxytetrahydrobiopterin dehydratase
MNMPGLSEASCVPCRGGVPTVGDAEIAELLLQILGWQVVERGGVKRLWREYAFPDFRQAMAFAVAVGEIAEREGHHPDLQVAWGRVGVEIWTHKIHGLHRNDFVLAAKIDRLGGPH